MNYECCDRIIETGFENFKKGKVILDSVMGQMSDGYWENSNWMEPYWVCANITDNGNIEITGDHYHYAFGRFYRNPYKKMDIEDIRNYYANKIRFIVRAEYKDEYEEKVRNRISKENGLDYYCGVYKEGDEDKYYKVVEEVKDYLKEHPFPSATFKKLFNDTNNNVLVYLSDGSNEERTIRVKDAYKAYKMLKKD